LEERTSAAGDWRFAARHAPLNQSLAKR
jgi:hypothetical protein